MTQRLRRILIMIVMALLTVTLMTASLLCSVTYARYAGGKFNEEKSIYDQIIEFVGANQYEVYSPEELVEAIENGYSYIKIGDGAEEPFVITTGVTDVTANLVIDLNGTTIVRNSRNPVLDVQRNVSAVLVFDSSVKEGGDVAKEAGSFYNPVGSALQVSGGTLTVAAGRYDSGPKDGIADAFTAGNATSFKLFKRNGSRAAARDYTAVSGDSTQGQVTMPALSADVYIPEGTSSGYNYIEGDTYLIYSLEQNCYVDNGTLIVNAVKDENTDGSTVITGDALAVPCNAASCDFYYYYPIGTANKDGFQDYAVIYGYNDVKRLAEDSHDTTDATETSAGTDLSENGLVWPYAAVRSIRSTETVQEGEGRTTGGEGFMRGGAFSTYFGTENTYGIYAEGGTLSVADGVSFTAVGEGVCIRSQTSSTTTDSNAAASLEISGGTFSSELGDTIQMEGGSVTITGGTFTKNADVDGAQSGEGADNGSAIDIQGGSLSASNAVFTVTGDHVNGIKMDKGTETGTETQTADVIKNVTFDFNQSDGGTYVAAIQVAGGTLEVSGSIFNFNKEASSNTAFSHNNGIYVRSSGEGDAAQSGTVTATGCTFTFGNNSNSSVKASAGIASVGGEVTATNCTFTLPGYSNYGIYATGGETTVTGGSITMTGRGMTEIGSGENAARGNDNFGINISGGEVTVSGCEISVSGTYSSGILAQGGEVNLSGTDADKTTITITGSHQNNRLTSSAVSSETVTNGGTTTAGTINIEGVVTINSDSLGITARGKDGEQGKISVAGSGNITLWQGLNGDQTIVPMCTTGIYVSNGIVENEGTISLYSTIDPTYSWVPFPEETTLTSNIYNGVYVQGGSITSEGKLNVTFTGVENDDQTSHNDDSLIASITNNPTEGEYKVNKAQYDDANQAIKDNQDSNLYQNFQTKSYAVRVEAAATGRKTEVSIADGTISNSVGGGVYVGGGTVTLGNEISGPTVQTSGTALQDQLKTDDGKDKYYIVSTRIEKGWFSDSYYVTLSKYIPLGSGTVTGTWSFAQSLTGGDAVKVVDGTLNVYDGKYEAAQGNGIFVSGAVSGGEGKAVNISGGTFLGYNGGYTNREVTGPAGSYGIKIIGGSVSISNGTFGASSGTSNGAAFFMGTETQTADIDITGGNYYAYNTDAVSTFRYIALNMNNVTVATTVASGTARAAVSVQNDEIYANMENRGAEITIEGGRYSSTNGYGLWYGAGIDKVAIKDGTFTGQNSSGLYFYVQPNDSNVQLSGGKYRGDGSAWGGNELGSIQTSNLLVTNNDDGTQTLGWLYDLSGNAIVYAYRDYTTQGFNCTHVGGNQGSVALDGNLSVTWLGGDSDPLSDYHFIAVKSGSAETSLPDEKNRDFGADWATKEYPST